MIAVRVVAATCVAAVMACEGGHDTRPRTVSGQFGIAFNPETGSRVFVPAQPWTVPPWNYPNRDPRSSSYRFEGLLVPDSSASGYTAYPSSLAEDYSFSIPGVPGGPYFLVLRSEYQTSDGHTVRGLQLTELSASTPDLSMAVSCRPDAARPTRATSVALDASGLETWTSGSNLMFVSSQACSLTGFASLTPPPSPGATSYRGSVTWEDQLPRAEKRDVVFLYQHSRNTLDNGRVFTYGAVRSARFTDFSLVDGDTAPLTVALQPPPAMGTLRLDLRWSEFARLAADINPSATATCASCLGAVSVAIAPPQGNQVFGGVAAAVMNGPATADVDYGTLAYGRFLDPGWRERRKAFHDFAVNVADQTFIVQLEVRTWGLLDPVVPLISPPKQPRINGKDAFTPQAGVGLQPVISWSPPARGTATSYVVSISELTQAPEGATTSLAATVRSTRSFRVPPGFMRSGARYFATITAVNAGGDGGDRLETDLDWSNAPCVSAPFTP